jgi:hypothetical protein
MKSAVHVVPEEQFIAEDLSLRSKIGCRATLRRLMHLGLQERERTQPTNSAHSLHGRTSGKLQRCLDSRVALRRDQKN